MFLVDESVMAKLSVKDYLLLKKTFGVSSDFVFYFEDSEGNVVPLSSQFDKYCTGHSGVSVGGSGCGLFQNSKVPRFHSTCASVPYCHDGDVYVNSYIENNLFKDISAVSVGIDGNVSVFGNIDHSGGDGVVYVFRSDSSGMWFKEAELVASDSNSSDDVYDLFGRSVDVDGDVIVVGASGNLQSSSKWDAGAVYVFERSGGVWMMVQKLTASDRKARDDFGYSVSVDGDVIVVGAPKKDGNGVDSGGVYVFEKSGGVWSETDKILPSGVGEVKSFRI